MYYPLRDDTLSALRYQVGGLVSVNHALPKADQTKAQTLIELVGLDKVPGHPDLKPSDKRWLNRSEVWNLATRYLQKYQEGSADVETVLALATGYGFWSVWMTIFTHEPAVVAALTSVPSTRYRNRS